MEKYMIIDGERVSFTDEKNILAVIRKARNYFTDILLLLRFIHLWCMPYVCRRRQVGWHCGILFYTAKA